MAAWQDRFWKPSYFDALAVVKGKAEAEGVTLVEAALRWLYHHSALRSDDGVRTPRDTFRSLLFGRDQEIPLFHESSRLNHHEPSERLERESLD